jgi:probable rRNA maturation factor
MHYPLPLAIIYLLNSDLISITFMSIQYATYNESDFKMVKPILTSKWIKSVAISFKKEVSAIQYIFCLDEELLKINQQFLNHDEYTDIITFDYSEGKTISGDIYVSIERVFENARNHKVSSIEELQRVLIHGVLHLCGLKDKSKVESKEMRLNEDKALKMRPLNLKEISRNS